MPTSKAPLAQTPSQTVGPFFGYALPYDGGAQLVPALHPDSIRLHGSVFDGRGEPIVDALIELWQPDAEGNVVQKPGSRRRETGAFTGFGRCATDVEGHYEFSTLLPGAIAPSTTPWALITVFSRGVLHHLFTRAYFVDDLAAAPADPLLDRIDSDRRHTLLARLDARRSYRFDIRLQGDDETVFLRYPGAGGYPEAGGTPE